MKKILVFHLWILIFFGCKDTGDRPKSTNEILPLRSLVDNSGNIEPLALLNFKGIYHLFYTTANETDKNKTNIIRQSTSKDLINWSGSSATFFGKYNNSVLLGGIIPDSGNITGYGTNGSPPLVALLTQRENDDHIKQGSKAIPILAFSTDNGNSWTVSADKINFPQAFINHPQNIGISWYQPTKKWIMSVALNDHLELYSSPDLRSWNFESSLGKDFFPEDINWKRTTLFPLRDRHHWALLVDIKRSGKNQTAGGTVYFIGDFDGHNFINQSSQLHWLDYGEDIYGSLITVAGDGRIINMGWKNSNGELLKNDNPVGRIITFPRELDVANSNTDWFITSSPVQELKEMYGRQIKLGPINVSYKVKNVELISGVSTPMDVYLKFNTSNIQKGSFPTRFGISFWNSFGEHITFEFNRFGYYDIDKSGLRPSSKEQQASAPVKMPYDHSDSTMSLRLIVDVSTIECFTEDGKVVMTGGYSLRAPFNNLKLFSVNGDINFVEGKIIELRATRP